MNTSMNSKICLYYEAVIIVPEENPHESIVAVNDLSTLLPSRVD